MAPYNSTAQTALMASIVLGALLLAAAALAAATANHRISAHLTTRVEVPRPIHVTKKAFGAFTGTYVIKPHALEVTWKLSFVHLTGTVTGVTLSKGKPGLIGTRITVLCKLKTCKSGMRETTLRVIPWRTSMPLSKFMLAERSRKNLIDTLGTKTEAYFPELEERLRAKLGAGDPNVVLAFTHYLYLGKK